MAYPYDPTPVVPDPPIGSGVSAADAREVANNAWIKSYLAIDNIVENNGDVFTRSLGAGRFIGATLDPSLNPEIGTGATVRLPNAVYLIHGRAITINEPEPEPYAVVTDIALNKPGGVEVFVRVVEDDGVPTRYETAPELQFDTFPTSPADLETVRGLLHVGRVFSNLTSVTSIAPSTRYGFGIIPNLEFVMAQIANLVTRVTALEGGSGGSGSGGGFAYVAPAPWSSTDPRSSEIVIDEMIQDAIDDASGLAVIREQPEVKHLLREDGALAVGLAEVNQMWPTRSENATIVLGVTGNGEGGTIDDLEEGTAIIDENTGTIGPI